MCPSFLFTSWVKSLFFWKQAKSNFFLNQIEAVMRKYAIKPIFFLKYFLQRKQIWLKWWGKSFGGNTIQNERWKEKGVLRGAFKGKVLQKSKSLGYVQGIVNSWLWLNTRICDARIWEDEAVPRNTKVPSWILKLEPNY